MPPFLHFLSRVNKYDYDYKTLELIYSKSYPYIEFMYVVLEYFTEKHF